MFPWMLFGTSILNILSGFVAAVVASEKSRSGIAFFLIGFLLGPVGVVIAFVVSPGVPPAGRYQPKRKKRNDKAAGWYDDPWHITAKRWYDGAEWTTRVMSAEAERPQSL